MLGLSVYINTVLYSLIAYKIMHMLCKICNINVYIIETPKMFVIIISEQFDKQLCTELSQGNCYFCVY